METTESLNNKTVSRDACVFVNRQVAFAESQTGVRQFTIVGYSGGIIKNHFYWGNLAFDLKGLTFAKSVTPVLGEHFHTSRLGFTTKQEIGDTVYVEGQFLNNANAQELAKDMDAGFPMEASLYVPPIEVERVKDGESVEVNGHTLEGPGTVFREAVIKEVSICVFGADDQTQTVAARRRDNTSIHYQTVGQTVTFDETNATDEQLKEHFEHSKGVQNEFGDVKAYIAFVKSERDRKARVFGDNLEAEQAETITRLEKENKSLAEELQIREWSKLSDIQLHELYSRSQALQHEFGEEKSFVAFVRHESRRLDRAFRS